MWTYLRANWKTNLMAAMSVIYSAQQFTAAVIAWENHQPTNWRLAIISLIVAAGLFAAKDGDNHSTAAQVQKSTDAAAGK